MPKSKAERVQSRFDGVLTLLEAYVKLLATTAADQERFSDLSKVVANLKKLPESERTTLLQSKRPTSSPAAKRVFDEVLSVEQAAALTLTEVEKTLSSEGVTRAQLERIASIRFGMSKGALSLLPREALIDKIRTLVEHEGTHESIARAASGGHDVRLTADSKEKVNPPAAEPVANDQSALPNPRESEGGGASSAPEISKER